MARGRVTAAYDSWHAVPFCLVLLVWDHPLLLANVILQPSELALALCFM